MPVELKRLLLCMIRIRSKTEWDHFLHGLDGGRNATNYLRSLIYSDSDIGRVGSRVLIWILSYI